MESKVPPIPKHAEVEADPSLLARFNSAVIEEFRANGGVVGGPFKDSAVMLLTMTGAKSGQRRLTPLEYFQVDGRVIFVGTRGGAETNPAWVHNVRANPNVHVEIGAESYDAVARELSGDESLKRKVLPTSLARLPFCSMKSRMTAKASALVGSPEGTVAAPLMPAAAAAGAFFFSGAFGISL